MHFKSTAKTIQNLIQTTSFFWNNSTGKQTCFLQSKRIKWITSCLKRLNRIKFSMNIHITTVENNLLLTKLLQCDFYRLLPIQKNRHIQYCTAIFITIWRCITPSTAPVDTKRQFYCMLFCDDSSIFIIRQISERCSQNL